MNKTKNRSLRSSYSKAALNGKSNRTAPLKQQ